MRKFFFGCLWASVFFVGGALAGQWLENSVASAQAAAPAALSQEQLSDINAVAEELFEVYAIIRDNYVEEISGDELIRRAARGMVASLDPHSAYLDLSEYENFVEGLTNEEYGGVGIYIGSQDDWIQVIAPIYDSPASRANIEAGDIILKIDGASTQGMPTDEAVKKMRGKAGDILKLDLAPASGGALRQVELVRETIVTPSVLSARVEGDYGYLRITRFQTKTLEDLVSNINGMMAEADAPLKGVVLDLRNNPGGFLTAGVGAAAMFLPAGSTVVLERGRGNSKKKVFTASPDFYEGLTNRDALQTMPIAVLVNNGSASASEIVAGALQDHRRGVILGTRTYGKASVQSLLQLQSAKKKAALRLTTARYFTPNNRNIQARGIEPDIVILPAEVTQQEEGFAIREDDVSGHLENTSEEDANASDANAERPPFISEDDYQYEQAMQILKALAISKTAANTIG